MERVRTLDARGFTCFDDFRAAVAGTNVPMLLSGVTLQNPRIFDVNSLLASIGDLRMPEKSTAHTFCVGDQGTRAVMLADPELWHPQRCTFHELAKAITTGSGLYLSTQTPSRSCKRIGEQLKYDSTRCSDGSDVLVKELVQRMPVPSIVPCGDRLTVSFALGSYGKNFGLRTDSFSEQFLVQHQGSVTVFLLLPQDASLVLPFSFLSSGNYCKSERRSFASLDCNEVECVHVVLRPGDVLYIPPFWWHEERIVSEGHALSTTFRLHLEDDDRFHATLNNISVLRDRAKDRGGERLANHLCSFLAHGLSRATVSRTYTHWPLQVAMLLTAGIVLGRWSNMFI